MDDQPRQKRSKSRVAAQAAQRARRILEKAEAAKEVESLDGEASVQPPSLETPPSDETSVSYDQKRFLVPDVKKVDPTPADYMQIQEEIALLEAENKIIYGLPHLHGWKFYKWAREFFESRNKTNFLCAANQISKSSTQIRKAIHWATAKELWPQLWKRPPKQFWYLYPSQEVVNIEFELKWKTEFLPRGEYEDHPVYGWKVIKDRGDIKGIRFNSGVFLFFKTYTKDVQHLQTGTCDAMFCDEELPENLYDELAMRMNATDGYFHMVFTATLGQDIWRRTMEPEENEEEAFPTAAKWTVSLYEAMFYEDETPSHWTKERISAVMAKCKNHQEVLKRVYGRFIVLEGRKYPTFDATRHMKASHPIPSSWLVYSGVDIGSGGEENHPAAIAFVGVRPDFRAGRVFLGWRGDKIQTVDSDIVKKYIEMKKDHKLAKYNLAGQYYDWSSKDFEITATRMGESFLKADKSHEKGEGVLNTLFKNDMLYLYEDDDGELSKLARELSTLKEKTDKKKAKDDFIDALRYAVSQIPWDFSMITGAPSDLVDEPEKPMNDREREIAARRAAFVENQEEEQQRIEDELEEWNNAYG